MKRFTMQGTKLKTLLNYPEEFSFPDEYIEGCEQHVYRLYAIIVHQGYST